MTENELKVVFNQDGSIKVFEFPKYVTQGSNGVTKLTVAIDGGNIQSGKSVIARFKMEGEQTDETNTLVFNTNEDSVSLYGKTYQHAKSVYLTAAQTAFTGVLLCSIEVIDLVLNTILYSYNCKFIINPTTYNPDSTDTRINNAQYENLVESIQEVAELLHLDFSASGKTLKDLYDVVGYNTLKNVNFSGTPYVYQVYFGQVDGNGAGPFEIILCDETKKTKARWVGLAVLENVLISNVLTNSSTYYAPLIAKGKLDDEVATINTALAGKQNTLTAGTNITITGNTISASFSGVTIQVVETLPASGQSNVIYFVPKTGSTNDVYDEYVWIDGGWEFIGTTAPDLTNYYTKTQSDGRYAPKANGVIVTSNVELLTPSDYEDHQLIFNRLDGCLYECDRTGNRFVLYDETWNFDTNNATSGTGTLSSISKYLGKAISCFVEGPSKIAHPMGKFATTGYVNYKYCYYDDTDAKVYILTFSYADSGTPTTYSWTLTSQTLAKRNETLPSISEYSGTNKTIADLYNYIVDNFGKKSAFVYISGITEAGTYFVSIAESSGTYYFEIERYASGIRAAQDRWVGRSISSSITLDTLLTPYNEWFAPYLVNGNQFDPSTATLASVQGVCGNVPHIISLTGAGFFLVKFNGAGDIYAQKIASNEHGGERWYGTGITTSTLIANVLTTTSAYYHPFAEASDTTALYLHNIKATVSGDTNPTDLYIVSTFASAVTTLAQVAELFDGTKGEFIKGQIKRGAIIGNILYNNQLFVDVMSYANNVFGSRYTFTSFTSDTVTKL